LATHRNVRTCVRGQSSRSGADKVFASGAGALPGRPLIRAAIRDLLGPSGCGNRRCWMIAACASAGGSAGGEGFDAAAARAGSRWCSGSDAHALVARGPHVRLPLDLTRRSPRRTGQSPARLRSSDSSRSRTTIRASSRVACRCAPRSPARS
jgi:hypothetical protein